MICLHQVTHTYFCWETVNIHTIYCYQDQMTDSTVVQLTKCWVPHQDCRTIWDSKILATAVTYIATNGTIKYSDLKRMQ